MNQTVTRAPAPTLMFLVVGVLTVTFLATVSPAAAAPGNLKSADAELHDVENFPTVVRRSVTVWSDGTRLAADIFRPKDLDEDSKLPAIVLCHGWGGKKEHLNRGIAPWFASAGYVVLAFDYRGWGESDSRLIVTGDMPKPDKDGKVTVEALAVRELVDPMDQQEDIDAAISFIEGEPLVDPSRIGLWGSSFGGGHVIWRAAHDRRVKAVAAQVGAMDQRLGIAATTGLEAVHQNRIKRARGELAPVPLGDDKPEGLVGSPYYERFIRFSPVQHTAKINAAVLIIDAKQEHYFDIRDHGKRVYEQLLGQVPVEYHAWDMTHYDVYSGDWLKKAMETEIDFFNRHL